MEAIDASVVVCVRDNVDHLHVSLAHLENQTFPSARYEVLVVDGTREGRAADVLNQHAAGSPMPVRYCAHPSACPAHGYNQALEVAKGHWALFLDADLLAGPHFVEGHIEAQKWAGGAAATVGRIGLHPEMDPRKPTRWSPDVARPVQHYQPLRFPDWRVWNLSLPRKHVLRAGGFDESARLEGLYDVDLAWQLETGGFPGIYTEEACAYAWRPASLVEEQQRAYAEGYALRIFLEKSKSEIVRQRYLPVIARRLRLADSLVVPLLGRVGRLAQPEARFYRLLLRRTTNALLRKGYRDARRGRPPRLAR